MNCIFCGKMYVDGEQFCSGCGKKLPDHGQDKPISHPVRERAMKLLGSPMFIIASIAAILSFVLAITFMILSRFMPQYAYNSYELYIFNQLQMYFGDILNYVRTSNLIVEIIGKIPTLLKIIGVFVLLCKVRSENKNAGFSLIKVGMVMDLVCFAIIATIICVAMTFALIAGTQVRSDDATVAIILMVVLVVAILFFFFLYLKGLIEAVNIARRAVSEDVCTKKASMYVVVINFISVILMLLSCAFVYFTYSYFGMLELKSVLFELAPSLLNCIAIFMFSLLMIRGRSLYSIHLAAEKKRNAMKSFVPASAPSVIAPMTPPVASVPVSDQAKNNVEGLPTYAPAPTPSAPASPSANYQPRNTELDSHFKQGGDL